MRQPRFLLSAGASGSGKTMITCGILAALRKRGKKVSSFKCGPDYIDPMFHSRVLKAKSRNLDTFFTDRETTRYLFAQGAEGTDISVMEGVMGYYDGLGGISTKASASDLADVTDTPVVLIVNTKGMSLSVAAYIKGFLEYEAHPHIKGVIFNQMSPMLYPRMKKVVEEQLHVRVYGYVPVLKDLTLDSRHQGLVLPEEVEDLEKKFSLLADTLEQTLDLDGLISLAEEAPEIENQCPENIKNYLKSQEAQKIREEKPVIAKDEAFCFIYEDNLKLLRELGAELVPFSPLHDKELPEGTKGLLLYGGYPELYAKELEDNAPMRQEIQDALNQGMPCLAECGGFMYLHETMEDLKGNAYQGTGNISGRAFYTGKLTRFGYVELSARKEGVLGAGKTPIRAHEFHYFDSTSCGGDFVAKKPGSSRNWTCIHGTGKSLWGFPHLYYHACPQVAEGFLKACLEREGEER